MGMGEALTAPLLGATPGTPPDFGRGSRDSTRSTIGTPNTTETSTMNRPCTPRWACAAALLATCCSAAHAELSPWLLRVGPASALFDARSTVEVGGAAVPGADIGVKDNTTLALEVGYTLSPQWTARLAVGVPPTTTLSAGGSLTAMVPPLSGTLGKVKYGPAVLSLTYGFGALGPVRPYVGAGINYTRVFESRDADVGGLEVDSAWGSALEAGFELPMGERWSVFADVRKVFVKTKARGSIPALGNPPAAVTIKLDPSLVHIGVGYRF